MTKVLALLCAIAGASSATASPFPPGGNAKEQANPVAPAVLPLRERAALENKWLAERLDTIAPALMREQGVDMWVMIAREYVEDPVVATMLDAESMHARRRTILLFYDPGQGRPIEDAFFDGSKVTYLDGRQDRFHLIRGR